MAVLKVMFSAVVTAMLGLGYCLAMGWIALEQLYAMPSIYGAQVVGGLLFGVGFVMSAWCPGTAAVGVASGKADALIFLGGATLGSVVFSAVFPAVKGLYRWGDSGAHFVWHDLGLSFAGFALLFVLVAVGCFWGAELIERRARRAGGGTYLKSPFLKAFSVALVVLAVGLVIVPAPAVTGTAAVPVTAEAELLGAIERGDDHLEPEELADRLLSGDPSLLVVDVRTPGEFTTFHIRGAVNVSLADLPAYLAPYRHGRTIVLYSNGMTHPAQARDALARSGFQNVYLLTDGLRGFMERCLKPVSLRDRPLSALEAERVSAWRRFFTGARSENTRQP
jgi:thiosulfate/3-mercaptopyruvate sulfurtransferase